MAYSNRNDRCSLNRNGEGVNYRRRINAGKAQGEPARLKSSGIEVADVLERLDSGMSEQDILEELPSLTPEDIRACVEYRRSKESSQLPRIIFLLIPIVTVILIALVLWLRFQT